MRLLLKAKWVCHRISVNLTPIWNIIVWYKSVFDLTGDPTQIHLLKGEGWRIKEAEVHKKVKNYNLENT